MTMRCILIAFGAGHVHPAQLCGSACWCPHALAIGQAHDRLQSCIVGHMLSTCCSVDTAPSVLSPDSIPVLRMHQYLLMRSSSPAAAPANSAPPPSGICSMPWFCSPSMSAGLQLRHYLGASESLTVAGEDGAFISYHPEAMPRLSVGVDHSAEADIIGKQWASFVPLAEEVHFCWSIAPARSYLPTMQVID